MIEIKNITKKFEEKLAVNDLSLTIKKGEVVGFLGPNGAGKTTTMRIITGFMIPDSGEVLIEKQSVLGNPVLFKSFIGYMPENNPLYKDMLVKDSLEYVLDLHNVAKEERKKRLNEVVKATHLQNVYYRPISELSKGYKQRVGLAQVLIHDPKILILDEPTEGLDPNQRSEIRELIKKIGKERTVIVSTHVMQEVEAMCDRIVIINEGKVIADGERSEILKMKGKSNVIKLTLRTGKSKVKKEDFKDIKTKSIEIRSFNKEFSELEIVTTDQDFFEKVNKKAQEKGWTIYELSQKTQNLEDVFRELTQK